MGLFDKLKRQDDNSPANEGLISAKEHYDNGQFEECLQTLAWGFKKDVNYKPLYKLAADSLGKLNAPDEQKLFETIYRNMNDANAFYDLGNFYFSVEHYDMAQTFFEKTLQLNPKNEEALHDLAICYARRFEIGKALEVLTKADPNDFWNLYFFFKCKILDNKVDGVQEAINDLQAFLDEQPNQDDVAIPKMKVAELQETLPRFNTIPVIQTHIRDWQFIQYGGVVLDFYKDDEDDEDDEYVAGGRYVSSWGSTASIKTLANKLKQFADKLSISFKGIATFNDRDSEIIGRLFAKELGVSFNFYDAANANEGCLIVSSDSSLFTEHEELNLIQNGQVLFSANHSWLNSSSVCPDIIGFMTQTYSFPWGGGGMKVTDMETGDIEFLPPDDRSPEEIATDIFNLQQQPEDINKHLEFYADRKEYLKGIGKQTNNNRYIFMIESPVPGSYFA